MDPLTMGLVAGGVSGGLSSILGGKKKKPKLLMLPEQLQAYSKLLPGLTAKGGEFINVAGQPYTGQMTAPMSEYEELGLKSLGDMLKQPMPTESKLFGLTSEELEKTMGGKEYDPSSGQYYEAFRTNLMRELQQAKDRIAQRSSARDAYFGGGRMQQEREVEEGAMGSLAQELGRLYEAERTRRLGAVPLSLQQMGWAEQVPMQRVAAAEELGALPRLIEQADLSARYSDFLRTLQELGMSLQEAVQMAAMKPEYWAPAPSDTSGLTSGMGNLALLMALQGGGQGGGGGIPMTTSAATVGTPWLANFGY